MAHNTNKTTENIKCQKLDKKQLNQHAIKLWLDECLWPIFMTLAKGGFSVGKSWIGWVTYPDFKSVILKQFVASSPTFPLRTTLDINGDSIGEIRFKATSGDILTWLANHHWKKKERMVIRISKNYIHQASWKLA